MARPKVLSHVRADLFLVDQPFNVQFVVVNKVLVFNKEHVNLELNHFVSQGVPHLHFFFEVFRIELFVEHRNCDELAFDWNVEVFAEFLLKGDLVEAILLFAVLIHDESCEALEESFLSDHFAVENLGLLV